MTSKDEQKTLFNTEDLAVDRVTISAGDIGTKTDELIFTVEESDLLRENPPKDFGVFYTLECTTDKGPTALNFGSSRLYKGLKECLDAIRGKPVRLTAKGEGFSRNYELDLV